MNNKNNSLTESETGLIDPEKAEVWENLPAVQIRAAYLYAQCGNTSEVASEVDVQPRTIRRWLRIPAFAALVNKQLEVYEERSLVSRQYKEATLLNVIDIALGLEDTHGMDKEGMEYSGKETNLNAVNQAIATLNKMEHDDRALKAKIKETKEGPSVILNIENANFNSNRHFDLLNPTTIDMDVVDINKVNP